MEDQIQAGETTLAEYEKWFVTAHLDESWKDYVAWKAEHHDEPIPDHVNRIPCPFVIDYQRMDLSRVPDLLDYVRRPVPIPDYVIQNMMDHGAAEEARRMVEENVADIERYESRHGKGRTP